MKLGDDSADAWDTITARKAAEAPVIVQQKAQQAKVGKLAIGIGLIVAALVMSLGNRKGRK